MAEGMMREVRREPQLITRRSQVRIVPRYYSKGPLRRPFVIVMAQQSLSTGCSSLSERRDGLAVAGAIWSAAASPQCAKPVAGWAWTA